MGTKPQVHVNEDYENLYGFHMPEHYVFKARPGLDEKGVREISWMKSEPAWMLEQRLRGFQHFNRKPMPTWANTELLNSIKFDDIFYYLKSTEKKGETWDDVPPEIKETFDRLGIPEAERKFLAGVSAQYESETVYHSMHEDLAKQGVIFLDMDSALKEQPEIVKRYFGTVIPSGDNKFAALNTSVWSGGSFIYVPKGVKVEMPLQAYFRINAKNMGQFERTLIIADEGAQVTYFEGCTAPSYSSDSLHSAVVELIAMPHARIRYVTIQNWSKNVYNLVTKRAVAHEDATVEWLDGNLGCVRAGELVYTERGPKPIETVQSGTRVWSFDEEKRGWVLRPVVATKASGVQQVYEVVFSNGRTLHLTDNHPLLSVHHDRTRPKKLGRYALRWTPLRELSVGRHVLFPTALPGEGAAYTFVRPSLSKTFTGRNQYGAIFEVTSHARVPINVPSRSNEDLCWTLGLWLAEGDYDVARGVSGGPRFGRVGWSVPRGDRARRRVLRLLDRYVGQNRIDERKDGVYFRVHSLEFALWLQANGFTSGARQKRIPEWVFALPNTQRLAFLAGYFDGDGHAHQSGLVVKSASRELLCDVQMTATLCGVHASAVHTQETTQDISGTGRPKTYTTHRVALTGVNPLRPYLSRRLRDRVARSRQPHHYQRPLGMRASRLLPRNTGVTRIVAIRRADMAPTYDLEIEGTSNFVVNGVLVHNSKLTMKYPGVYLMGRGARGEVLSVAFAGDGQHQDAGAKMIHAAPDTSSVITSKSISKGTGRTTYRGLVKVYEGAENSKSTVRCDALMLNKESRSDTYPTMEIDEKRVQIGHEATVSKIGDEQIFYAMSRGLSEAEAMMMIVNGFIEPFVKELPLEYSVELNRLVQLEMEGAVG